jgi:hypothetical protein
MDQILVWYRRGRIEDSIHLTIQYNSIAYTIAEYESRNQDTVITHYQDNNWNVIPV